jgi:hypothetical protein
MAGEVLPSGSTNTQGLADWAAPYITNYLGQAQALAQTPYQTYQGPLTAGPSELQNKTFQGLAGLTFPSNLGQSFSSTGAYTPPTINNSAYQQAPIGLGAGAAPAGGINTTPPPDGGISAADTISAPQGIAAQYMNPYLQNVLTPQLNELRRQNDITNTAANAKLTQAGAFGGGRQAIMNSENNRNLLQAQNQAIGTGYSNAYDKAMQQFNTEQGQAKTLADMMGQQGAVQRGITSEGIAADLAEFNQQRQYPYQQVQFQRDMISGLPTGSVTNTPGQLSGIGSLLSVLGGGTAAASALGYKNVGDLLNSLGLDIGQKTP